MRVPGFVFAALVIASCSKAPIPGPKIDPALAGLIPSDSTTLLGLRLEALQKTDIYKKSLEKRTFPQITGFAQKTGIDTKNLWELLYVSNGKNGALIGRGKFTDESEPRLGTHEDKRFNYKGVNLVGNDQTAILLIGPTVLAVGDTPELEAFVDAREKSGGPPPPLVALLKDIPPNSHVWAAFSGGPPPLPQGLKGNLSNLNTMMSFIQRGTFALDFTSGMNGLATGTSGNEKDAEQLEGGLKALVGFGRLSTPANQPDLQQAWDGLRPTREGVDVKLHIEERPEVIDRLLTLLLGRQSSGSN
ncbi:MAG TPA: hypothetical protein VGN17_20930 [Bryobacteraceae bacterium]|jgi:hypothetical protein